MRIEQNYSQGLACNYNIIYVNIEHQNKFSAQLPNWCCFLSYLLFENVTLTGVC